MDFAKAFDKVPHRRLLLKLDRYGIRGKALNWTEAFLTQRKQRVVIDGKCSEWVDVKSSVPQGTVTGPMDFLVFINDLPQNLTSSVKLFADDCIVFRKVAGPEDAGMLQKDLDVLTAWQSKWQMAFNAQKCYVLRVTHSKSPKNSYTHLIIQSWLKRKNTLTLGNTYVKLVMELTRK
ncbi:putative RNA-directed DNA polymerase from mobile element jockey-like [Apostichopus japonicus]|uniref:Putative RNA-directed DNA polymerase from mobile element jockey-like n=1 Tax=Stichopus japonicus TaxID=307972 RepID=A0A2G8JYX6_STIJA|nr:putative RNA-directed DNA polymerase from mobile element jockey-like [Apostichopus japonicus]